MRDETVELSCRGLAGKVIFNDTHVSPLVVEMLFRGALFV